MKKQLSIALLAILLTLPVIGVRAQDVPPTVDSFPTVEQSSVTIEPTLVPTALPTEVPAAPPIDPTKVTEGLFSTIIALIAALAGIAFVAIVAAFFSMPPWLRPIILGILKNGLDVGDDIAATTPTDIDNVGLAELRKLYNELAAKQNATQSQVSKNTQDIATTNQAVNRAAQG